jgi:hypothetical protein
LEEQFERKSFFLLAGALLFDEKIHKAVFPTLLAGLITPSKQKMYGWHIFDTGLPEKWRLAHIQAVFTIIRGL